MGGRGRHLHDGQPDCSLQECRRMAGHLDEERRTVLLLNSTIIISKYFVDFIFPLYSTLHYILHCTALLIVASESPEQLIE